MIDSFGDIPLYYLYEDGPIDLMINNKSMESISKDAFIEKYKHTIRDDSHIKEKE